MSSDNPPGDPDDQQGRLEAYLAGFADGEGTFSVGVTRRSDLSHGFQLVPEFRVSQNPERATILELFRTTLQCGRIRINDAHRQSDRTMVYIVRKRSDLIEHVIPFFRRNPILSDKRRSFETFETIVTAMAAGRHRDRDHFAVLVELAIGMNSDGTRRKWQLSDVVGARTLRDCTPDAIEGMAKIQSELHGDMQSQAEMTWPPHPHHTRGGRE